MLKPTLKNRLLLKISGYINEKTFLTILNIKNLYFMVLLLIALTLFILPQSLFAEYANSYAIMLGEHTGNFLFILLISFAIPSRLRQKIPFRFIFSKIGLVSVFIIIEIYACMHTIYARNEDKSIGKEVVLVMQNVTNEYSSQVKWIGDQEYLFSKNIESVVTPKSFLSLDGVKNIRLIFNNYKEFLKEKNVIISNYKLTLLRNLQIRLKEKNGATTAFWKAYLLSSQRSEEMLSDLTNVQTQEVNAYIALANLFEKNYGKVIFENNSYQFRSIDAQNNFDTLFNQIQNLSKQESQLNHVIAEKNSDSLRGLSEIDGSLK
ncbi:MAG: hypothetical protein Q8L78_01540 [Coxiellaceae bacterium]|nr:hypothetical protein [Coxiellaceae bacterium]